MKKFNTLFLVLSNLFPVLLSLSVVSHPDIVTPPSLFLLSLGRLLDMTTMLLNYNSVIYDWAKNILQAKF